jgi:diguanylate cyclase (GGDEF)-like protein/PAS domain S-box-containing protein
MFAATNGGENEVGQMPLPGRPNEAFLFRALMASTADSIYIKDRDCQLVCVSRKMALDLGFSDPAELVGKTDVELFGETFGNETLRDDLLVMETDRPIVGMIEGRQLADGRTNWTLTTKWPIHDHSGQVVGLAGISREINEIRQAELALQHLATHDSLTELPNRFLLVDRVNQVLARARRTGLGFALLFLDIDDFKAVNDHLGHDVGDLLLRAFAQRLTGCVRQSDTVARLAGDEFVIVLDTIQEIGQAEAVAQHVERALARPFRLRELRVKVGVSIGISLYPEDGDDAEVLLKAADHAMYLAKREGGNRHQASPGSPPPGGGSPGSRDPLARP